MPSGVYKVCNIVDGNVYVGSAANLQRRKARHFRALRLGTHHNQHLQRAWDKHGEQCFTFEVVECVPKPALLIREQYWIEVCLLTEPGLYNHCLVAGSRTAEDLLGNTYAKGNVLSAETRARMSVSKRGNQNRKGCKHSPETRAKIAVGVVARSLLS